MKTSFRVRFNLRGPPPHPRSKEKWLRITHSMLTMRLAQRSGPLYANEPICFVVKNRNVCNYNEYKSYKLRLIMVG